MYSTNKKVNSMINRLVNFMEESIVELSNKHGVIEPEFHLIGLDNYSCYKGTKIENSILGSYLMRTTATVKVPKGSDKIDNIACYIIMQRETLLIMILNMDMNIKNIKKSLYFNIRHEMGHVVDFCSYIGLDRYELDRIVDEDNHAKATLMDYPENTSYKERLKRYLIYNHRGIDHTANKIAGITEYELISDFNRITGRNIVLSNRELELLKESYIKE